MTKFLTRCFLDFKVVFWSSKNALCMEEIVPAMLGRLKGGQRLMLVFVWSAQECELVECRGGEPTL
jgi:hypothetical protein